MTVKNLTQEDLALVELAEDGETRAPRPVLAALAARGFLRLSGGEPTLTAAGRKRGTTLRPIRAELATMFTAGGGVGLRAVSEPAITGAPRRAATRPW